MRRRVAAAVLLLACSSVALVGCNGDLIDGIESAVPSGEIGLPTAGITLPTGGITLPSITIGGGQGGAGEGGAAQGGEGGQPPVQTQPAPTVTSSVPAPAESPTATEESDPAADSSVSTWAWVLLALVLVTLVALMLMSARRRRGADDRRLAAQADGQLGWALSTNDDALVRWRANQIQLPLDQRDTDSELARRWTLLDERVTAATNDLLTLEASSTSDDTRQAAAALREAAERYRTSIDALAQSVVTGEQSRIAAASQALTADTTLLEGARGRLRQTAKL